MNGATALAGAFPLAAAGVLAVMLWRNLAGVRRLLSWRPTAVARLAPGRVEASGRIHVTEAPIAAFDGAPCVHRTVRFRAVATRITSGGGKTTYEDVSQWIGEPEVTFAPAELRDPSGHCVVDLERVTFVEAPEERVLERRADELFATHPGWREQAPPETKQIDVHEAILRDGAPVLLQGFAQNLDVAIEGDGNYRSAPGRLGIGAGEGALDLLPGRRGRLLLGAVVPMLAALLVVLWLGAMGAGVLYVAWAQGPG